VKNPLFNWFDWLKPQGFRPSPDGVAVIWCCCVAVLQCCGFVVNDKTIKKGASMLLPLV